MTDAPSGSTAPAKKVAGKARAGAGSGMADGKKRFEVKKVAHLPPGITYYRINIDALSSGTVSLYGLGIFRSTTALSAETISWIYVRLGP